MRDRFETIKWWLGALLYCAAAVFIFLLQVT